MLKSLFVALAGQSVGPIGRANGAPLTRRRDAAAAKKDDKSALSSFKVDLRALDADWLAVVCRVFRV